MSRPYFADFRAYINRLEDRGKLRRWKRPINKDTEMMPLMRLQYRGISDEQREAFLFENVLDSRYRHINARAYSNPEELIGAPQNPRRLIVGIDVRVR